MAKKIYLVSLGCDKNTVDSEVMLGLLDKEGYEITNDVEEADVAVVNTCCFIGDAKEESIDTIIELGELKKEGSLQGIIAVGCLAQRYHEEIEKELPEIDVIVGTTAYDKIVQAVLSIEEKKGQTKILEDIHRLPGGEEHRLSPAGEISSYLKIAEGCNKRCTYCIIPYVRGNFRSIPMEILLLEAESLAKQGTKELILVAQETTMYGLDLYGKKMLPALIKELAKIREIEWIRILYCYPEEITDELIEVIKTEPKVCHYIDMPIQHSANPILKKMNRRTTKEEITERIAAIRREIPDIVLRTTFITGFPGETEEDFIDLYNFADEMEFDRLGVFTYSPEEGTPAAKMKEQLPEEVKIRRRNEIMELQQEISFEKGEERVGKTFHVLVEGSITSEMLSEEVSETILSAHRDGKRVYIGRGYMDAPGVDGQIFFESDEEILSGELVEVEIIASDEYDLFGILV